MNIRQRLEIAVWLLLTDIVPTLAFGLIAFAYGHYLGGHNPLELLP